MKIGLLTYHHSDSYGATLQTFATCRVLKQLGHDVTIIDLPLHEGGGIIKRIAFLPKNLSTQRLWKKIYPPFTQRFNSYQELKTANFDFDCLLVGSDQTWNPKISRDLCRAFFLDFGGDNVRRVSYASSFALNSWPEEYQSLFPQVNQALHQFNAISVRENTGQELLKREFGLESTLVLDPTLLNTDYSELTGEIKPNEKMICFLMKRSPLQMQKVRQLAKEMHETPYQMATIYPCKGYKYIYPPSISQWLRNITGAKLVVTDSFHGLVFCLIYHKDFVVVTPDTGANSRQRDLMAKLGLSNRYFLDTDTISIADIIQHPIDYKLVDTVLAKERNESLDYLKAALS